MVLSRQWILSNPSLAQKMLVKIKGPSEREKEKWKKKCMWRRRKGIKREKRRKMCVLKKKGNKSNWGENNQKALSACLILLNSYYSFFSFSILILTEFS